MSQNAGDSTAKAGQVALQRFINAANLVPQSYDLRASFPLPTVESGRSTPQEMAETFRSALAQLPDPLRSHLLDFMVERMATGGTAFGRQLVDHYYTLMQVRGNFEALVVGKLEVMAKVTLQSDGTSKPRYAVVPEKDAMLTAIESARFGWIRKCPVCSRFFYASRANQSACYYAPGRCASTLRKRNQRANKKTRSRRHTRKAAK